MSEERRTLLRELIRTRPIATQAQLVALLAARGQRVTQSHVSRDLARLGVTKRDGAYVLPDAPPARALGGLVADIADNGVIVVVRTAAGAAPAVASAIDRARLPEILATLAGDDTVFVAPARRVTTTRVVRRLRELVA